MKGFGFCMIAFTHATHLDKYRFPRLSVLQNPQETGFLNVCQGNDWVFFSVKNEAGQDFLDPRMLYGLCTNPPLRAAVYVPSSIRATCLNSVLLTAPQEDHSTSAQTESRVISVPVITRRCLLRSDSDLSIRCASHTATGRKGIRI